MMTGSSGQAGGQWRDSFCTTRGSHVKCAVNGAGTECTYVLT